MYVLHKKGIWFCNKDILGNLRNRMNSYDLLKDFDKNYIIRLIILTISR